MVLRVCALDEHALPNAAGFDEHAFGDASGNDGTSLVSQGNNPAPSDPYQSDEAENDQRSEAAASYNAAFERVRGLMSCAPLFDLNALPDADRRRYRRDAEYGQLALPERIFRADRHAQWAGQ